MEKQIKFVKMELSQTTNWKLGQPTEANSKKTLCIVTFIDEQGNKYKWIPEKWETNLLISIGRYMIRAEEINFPLLKNPELRPDIQELKNWLERGENV